MDSLLPCFMSSNPKHILYLPYKKDIQVNYYSKLIIQRNSIFQQSFTEL